ncbi:hypothetical protein E2562_034315 [Oryza meyeriana var. granulata]|uniref:Uncharacterized protein n=1 Tax=Oryza meyeriana var. granulata TaxID=110450 RepID=A0A6G1FF10_9ORYZ|nr:hypothetical protein E2562_034315 [Oryza meyeriana var. granulata]
MGLESAVAASYARPIAAWVGRAAIPRLRPAAPACDSAVPVAAYVARRPAPVAASRARPRVGLAAASVASLAPVAASVGRAASGPRCRAPGSDLPPHVPSACLSAAASPRLHPATARVHGG